MAKKSAEKGGDRLRQRSGDTAQDALTLAAPQRERLVRLAYRFVWSLDDAEDAVHDAWLIATSHRDRLQDPKRWWSWIRRILINRCHEGGRKKLVRNRHETQYETERLRRTRASGGADGDQPPGDPLRAALDDLPRRQREVLVLRHLESLSFEEVGEILEISASTARVHARAGRESLRAILQKRFADWFAGHRHEGGGSP